MSNHDWLPHREQDLYKLALDWGDYLTDPQWYAGFGWDDAEIGPVVMAIQAYTLAYKNYQNDDSTVKRGLKKKTRKEAEALIRDFYESSIRFNKKIPYEKKVALGWREPDPDHTPEGVPTEFVEFRMEAGEEGQVILYFKRRDVENNARPDNYSGAVVKWLIADKPAASESELTTDDKLATYTPYTLTFPDTERGKIITVSMCWQNASGEKGPWCAIKWTVIP
jgi:hypothetical protein